mmetsp:Transcript_13958/g.43829  ORF Transcript_13958/g.43829 Transcript_13958/m.43829 type:complete len:389 (-) Transcript_13958:1368-2534(-)
MIWEDLASRPLWSIATCSLGKTGAPRRASPCRPRLPWAPAARAEAPPGASPQAEALAVGNGREQAAAEALAGGVPRQQELAEAGVGRRQPLVADTVLLHDQAQVLPAAQRHAVAGRHEDDELQLLRGAEALEDLPEDRQVLRLLLGRPALLRGAPADGRHVHGHRAAADDALQLHGVHHAAQEVGASQDGAEAGAEGPELRGDALVEEPVHVGLHKLPLVGLRELAVRGQAARAGPAEVAEGAADVRALVLQDAPEPVRELLAHGSQVVESQVPCAGRLQVVQQTLVEHPREDVGHQDVVEHGLAEQDPAGPEGGFVAGVFVEPVRSLVLVVPEEAGGAAAVQEALEHHLEELLGHARPRALFALEGHAERPPQLAVAKALEAREDVL